MDGQKKKSRENLKKKSHLSPLELSLLISQSESLEKDVAKAIEMGVSPETFERTYDFEKVIHEKPFTAFSERTSDPGDSKSVEASLLTTENSSLLTTENAAFQREAHLDEPCFQFSFSKDETAVKNPNHLNLLKREREILSPQEETKNLSSKIQSLEEVEKPIEKEEKLSCAFDQILKSENKTSCDHVKELAKKLSWQDAILYAKAKKIFKIGDTTALSSFEDNAKKLLGLNESTPGTAIQSKDEQVVEEIESNNFQSLKNHNSQSSFGTEPLAENQTLKKAEKNEEAGLLEENEDLKEATLLKEAEPPAKTALLGETTPLQENVLFEDAETSEKAALLEDAETPEKAALLEEVEPYATAAVFKETALLEDAETSEETALLEENAVLASLESSRGPSQTLTETNESSSIFWEERSENEIVEELIQSEIDTCKDDESEIYAKTKEFLASENYKSYEQRNYFGQ